MQRISSLSRLWAVVLAVAFSLLLVPTMAVAAETPDVQPQAEYTEDSAFYPEGHMKVNLEKLAEISDVWAEDYYKGEIVIQWYRDGAAIPQENFYFYIVEHEDVGSVIFAKVWNSDGDVLSTPEVVITEEPAAPEHMVYVAGVGMDDGDYLAVGASSTTTTKPAGGYARLVGETLTLYNFTYTGKGFDYETDYAAVIFSYGKLNVNVTGNNTIKAVDSIKDPEGIVVADGGDLSFVGGGSLSIQADMCAVYLYGGDVFFNEGKLTASSGSDCIVANGSINLSYGDINLTSKGGSALAAYEGDILLMGADVIAVGDLDTVFADGDVIMEGGSLTAKSLNTENDSYFAAVYCVGSFDVASGITVMASTSPNGTLGLFEPSKLSTYDLIVAEQDLTPPVYSDLWQSFPDVKREVERAGGPGNVWYVADGWLDYVVDYGLMGGYSSNGYFGPYDNITRGQVAVILYRAETAEDGGTLPGGGNIEEKYGSTTDPSEYGKFSYFEDMKVGQYYTAAVNWARDAGIMTGDSSTGYKTVRPNDPISREELCVMLDRYANGSTSSGEVLAPGVGEDIIGMNKVSSWAKGSVNWCINNGIIYGVDNHNGTYSMNPGDKTWRSAAAKMFTVLMRDVL